MAFPDPKKDAKRLAWEREREKDMVYVVMFRRKDNPQECFDEIRTRGGADASKNDQLIQWAIQDFQAVHGVDDWREISSGWYPTGYHYP
jgi:hypothetical protein